jgi:hypothetical protein|tara:strand:- start:565 stop:1068 length:504 start_codon:yes stop_codon:yes gene_type:complete
MKIMEKLSTYAALIGVIGAIGGGFYTWGQFNSRLDALESEPSVNLSPLKQKDKELTQQFDEVLLYANEYKVDLIDRIAKVEEKIKPVDLTKVFKEIGKVREQIAMLPKPANLQPLLSSLKELEEYAWELEEDIEELSKDVAIAQKENEVQNAMMEELKLKLKNPLGN